MAKRMLRSISVDVDVEIDQFDAEDIIQAAADAITEFLKQTEPSDKHHYYYQRWKATREAVDELRAALAIHPVDESGLPPPSTAAKIQSADDLRKFLETGKLPA